MSRSRVQGLLTNARCVESFTIRKLDVCFNFSMNFQIQFVGEGGCNLAESRPPIAVQATFDSALPWAASPLAEVNRDKRLKEGMIHQTAELLALREQRNAGAREDTDELLEREHQGCAARNACFR